MMQIELFVNGKQYPLEVEPDELLIDVLRERLALTGAKKGCGTGDCGACTVIIDRRAVASCLVLAVSVQGQPIETIEGLAQGDELHPIQQSFIDHHAVQCGYCTPGLVMASKALLDANPHPSEEEIRRGIAGNLCRCTGYQKVVEAIAAVAVNSEGEA